MRVVDKHFKIYKLMPSENVRRFDASSALANARRLY